MGGLVDLTGQRFGKLVVVGQAGRAKDGQVLWNCQCDCGQQRVVLGASLRRGSSESCGCIQRERARERLVKHGKSNTPLYHVWRSMMMRCGLMGKADKQDADNYKNRGITVCEEWQMFENFYRWALSHGYKHGLQIDRKDNNKSYCPENCHFVTPKQNTRNRRCSWKLPSGEHIYDFCERWVNRPLLESEYKKIRDWWRKHKRLPDFVFESIRKRAIAELEDAHRLAENAQ